MITGAIKSQIDQIWNAFWSGGISNPLEVIEQIMERRVFPEGNDPKGRTYEDLRWSRFKHFAPGDIYAVLGAWWNPRSARTWPTPRRAASARCTTGASAIRRWTSS
jgi:hypothetical protein